MDINIHNPKTSISQFFAFPKDTEQFGTFAIQDNNGNTATVFYTEACQVRQHAETLLKLAEEMERPQ